MNDKFFLDTNIFVYSLDRSSAKKCRCAAQLIREAVATRKGIVSYQVTQEFFNVALRKFAEPLTVPEAEQYLATVFRPLLAVHSSQSLYGSALRLCAQMRVSWYDALILGAGLEANCQILYSEDFQHGQRVGDMRIANPFLS